MTKRTRAIGQIPGMGVYLGFDRVFHQKARHEDLINYLRQFPMVDLVALLCGLSALVHNDTEKTPFPLQLKFAVEFSRIVPYMKEVVEILRQEPDMVFVHDEQLAVLTKYALLYANADEWPKGEALDLLIRLMLVYNSLHGATFEPKPGDYEAFMRFELRAVFNLEEHLAFVIQRYSKFFEWARTSPKAKSSSNFLDLDADFQRFYGLSYQEWSAAAYAFLSHFRSITDVRALLERKAILSEAAFYAQLKDASVPQRWLRLNSIPINEAQEFFRDGEANPSYSGMMLTPFLRRPILRLDEDKVCCPYIPYLENSLGSGIFFALLDGYNENDGREASNRFTRFFGEFFEDYIVAIIAENHPTPALVFGERKYISEEGTEANSTDLVIFEGSSAIFIDISASRFNLTKTLVDLDPASIVKDMEKLIVANAEQLDKSIRAFEDGRLVYSGVDAGKVTRVFPVVLTIQPVPRVFEFNKRVLTEVRERELLESVEHLEILTAEDAEGLGPLYKGGVLLSDILARKLAHTDPVAQNSSLKNYLFYFERDTLEKEVRREVSAEASAWFQNVLALAKKWAEG